MKLHNVLLALASVAVLLTACGQGARDASDATSEGTPNRDVDTSEPHETAPVTTTDDPPILPPAESGEGSLSGTVVDHNLDPIAQLQLQVIHDQIVADMEQGLSVSDSLRKNKAKGIWVTQVTTDDAGGFAVESLAPGTYRLRSKVGNAAPLEDPRFPPGGKDPVLVQFRRTSLTVHVSDAGGGQVHDASVKVQVQSRTGEEWSTNEEFEFTASAADGTYQRNLLGGERVVLEASHPEFGSASHTSSVETLGSGPVELILVP